MGHDPAAGSALPRFGCGLFVCHLLLARPPGCATRPVCHGECHFADVGLDRLRLWRFDRYRRVFLGSEPRTLGCLRTGLDFPGLHLRCRRPLLQLGLSGTFDRHGLIGRLGNGSGQAARPRLTGMTSRPRRMIRALWVGSAASVRSGNRRTKWVTAISPSIRASAAPRQW